MSAHTLESDANLPYLTKAWFEKCRSRFAFDGRVKDALHGLKYSERMDLADFFASELAKEAPVFGMVDLIVPVPLHPKRLRERGFNQSALLARRLGKLLKIPVDLDSLKRIQNIKPQVGLEREDRMANVRGAFAIGEKRAGHFAGRSALLIDDVLTTGATVNECARIMMKSGALSVNVLTVARTL